MGQYSAAVDQTMVAPLGPEGETRTTAPSAESVPRRRGRPRDPEADVRILDAAAELILERGYDAMTVDEVAARARVGKATVYRRWARKEDLAVAAMSQLYDAEMALPETGSIRDDLRAAYTNVLTFANSEAGLAYLRTTVAESVRDPRIAALYRVASERVEANAAAVMERAIERGELRPDTDLAWATQWLGGLLAMRLITGRPMPAPEEADGLVDQVLNGIGAPPA
jgi:AcrR family transcriptional regulator